MRYNIYETDFAPESIIFDPQKNYLSSDIFC